MNMKKKDEDAFLRSVLGVSPIEKKDKLKKKIPQIRINTSKKNYKDKLISSQIINNNPTKAKSLFILEKGNINKRLKKRNITIDKKIDFHGLSVLNAEQLFLDTVIGCYEKSMRCILFITGKGVLKKNKNNIDDTRLYYGKIRESFLNWVLKENLQKYILSVEQAGIEYGADGAFFVYLRKKI